MHTFLAATLAALITAASIADPLPPAGPSACYTPNRAPLQSGFLIKLPIASFKPSGWLGEHLKLQASGLTGHLGEISIWLTKQDNAWLSSDGHGKYGWEEVPYWLRGYSRLAYTLNDKAMLDETKIWIEGTLKSQRDNGDFGPIQMKNNKRDLWAQMLMLQVLQSYFEFSQDPRVLPFMTNYFKFQLSIPDADFLKDYWENARGGDNLASVYWLYNLTGDSFLLDLAKKIDKNTANWRRDDDLPNWHVVNIAECFREPATFFLQSKNKYDLQSSYHAYHLARARYGQVPGGMFGADENARPGHTDPHQAAETCSFVEQIYSNLIMSSITGDPVWAANTEDVALNSMPAAFTPDYRALRYLTAPNQAVSDAKNHAPGIANDGPFMLMNPFSSRCCQHNHSSAWINYTEHAWMATNDNGLAAILYSSGTLSAKTGPHASPATITTETHYPFDDTIHFTITTAPADPFPMYFRIPHWCSNATLTLNNQPTEAIASPGTYATLNRTWKSGDTVTLKLPMEITIRTWIKNKESVSIDFGPLTFSLKIDEQYNEVPANKTTQNDSGWQPGADPKAWPAHEILPNSPWNYALVLDAARSAQSFEVIKRPWPQNNQPFTAANSPIELRAKGKRIPTWKLDEHGLAAELPHSPIQSNEPPTNITLIPMGSARLRISAFPVAAPNP